jgi:NAD(P)-dependent dehydrogenase (short-subunit alcohol dehydrogenase family)
MTSKALVQRSRRHTSTLRHFTMSNYLITGSSRGLGLELVRQLAALPDQDVGVIIAVTRSAVAPGLQKLISTNPRRVVNVVIEDIADVGSVKHALPEIEQHLSGSALDVLVNNAGVMPLSEGGIETLSNTQFEEVFRTNVSSVQAVTSVLLPLLERGQTRKVVNM